jgi:hypothetical protein
MQHHASARDRRSPSDQAGAHLSDEDLEHVMGGLSRAWTPFTHPREDATATEPLPLENGASTIPTVLEL